MSDRWCEKHETWDMCVERAWIEQQQQAHVGDPATLCYPDDRYPLKVVHRTAKRMLLREVVVGTDAEDYGGPFPLVKGSSKDRNLPELRGGREYKAAWSEKKKGWYVAGSTPVIIGHAEYRRDYGL